VRELVDEYEARECLEAQLARDADKLECLIQAREYQAQGHEDLPPWITSAAALRSESARQLGEACQQVPPRQWWKAVCGVVSKAGLAERGLATGGPEARPRMPTRPMGARGSAPDLICRAR
jgi:putative hydrolase of HD superfamily